MVSFHGTQTLQFVTLINLSSNLAETKMSERVFQKKKRWARESAIERERGGTAKDNHIDTHHRRKWGILEKRVQQGATNWIILFGYVSNSNDNNDNDKLK